jgi:short subunit dehydrogenase-like uncharacterized protein
MADQYKPNPFDYANLGTNLLGTAVSGYGAYKAAETAEDQYRLALQAYQEERDRQQRIDEEQRQQQRLANTLSFGNYAQGLEQSAFNYQRPYSEMIGR